MILAQLQDGVCIGLQHTDEAKTGCIEVATYDPSYYLNRRYTNGAWGDKTPESLKEENGLTVEQEQTVLTLLNKLIQENAALKTENAQLKDNQTTIMLALADLYEAKTL